MASHRPASTGATTPPRAKHPPNPARVAINRHQPQRKPTPNPRQRRPTQNKQAAAATTPRRPRRLTKRLATPHLHPPRATSAPHPTPHPLPTHPAPRPPQVRQRSSRHRGLRPTASTLHLAPLPTRPLLRHLRRSHPPRPPPVLQPPAGSWHPWSCATPRNAHRRRQTAAPPARPGSPPPPRQRSTRSHPRRDSRSTSSAPRRGRQATRVPPPWGHSSVA